MPHYLALTYTEDVDWTAPQQADTLAEYRQFGEQNRDTIRSAAVLHPTGTATVVRVVGARGGDVVTADGPYAEAKEALTGYYILDAADLDAAVEIAARIPAAWGGAVELRPVITWA
jgi:hypothetical protein